MLLFALLCGGAGAFETPGAHGRKRRKHAPGPEQTNVTITLQVCIVPYTSHSRHCDCRVRCTAGPIQGLCCVQRHMMTPQQLTGDRWPSSTQSSRCRIILISLLPLVMLHSVVVAQQASTSAEVTTAMEFQEQVRLGTRHIVITKHVIMANPAVVPFSGPGLGDAAKLISIRQASSGITKTIRVRQFLMRTHEPVRT